MKEKIKVIDSPMGAGKTSYLIQMIKRNTENKYMFIILFIFLILLLLFFTMIYTLGKVIIIWGLFHLQ